ncbi:CDP-diacylglycerol-inositol 3-phosphatidyltransferase [Serendipita sp. 401]|nr:CDP-diacylglycerol-inositol 3-phosphatidyltransferase [Serendipita sp. 401]KAG9056032.1 CDP-diacylglycerol-inositol 3-phosphatidyltransferase [Serendipita sp. 407]
MSKRTAHVVVKGRRATLSDVDASQAHEIATKTTEENVYLFVPNFIGYARIVLAALALYYMPFHPRYCTLLYGASTLLDAADGYAARALKQASQFGAVLDMIVDRCTTSCLLCYLASAYPNYALVFQGLISLDFSSHYMHMVSTLTTGSRHHKEVKEDVSRILRWYYKKSVLFTMCAGNELFFVALYLLKWDKTPLYTLFPYAWTSSELFVENVPRFALRLTFAQALAAITFPISLGKNIVNIVQAWKASKVLVGVDLRERALAKTKAT